MKRPRGFTLIEVMITVAIVAILSAIAIPAYSEYVQRARIIDAVGTLSDMRNKMEQYFQDHRSWAPPGPANPPCGGAGTSVAPLPAATTYFSFVCDNLAANTYRIRALGVAGTSMAAFQYSINQANARITIALPPGWTMPGVNCWALKRDGSC